MIIDFSEINATPRDGDFPTQTCLATVYTSEEWTSDLREKLRRMGRKLCDDANRYLEDAPVRLAPNADGGYDLLRWRWKSSYDHVGKRVELTNDDVQQWIREQDAPTLSYIRSVEETRAAINFAASVIRYIHEAGNRAKSRCTVAQTISPETGVRYE